MFLQIQIQILIINPPQVHIYLKIQCGLLDSAKLTDHLQPGLHQIQC